MNKLPAASAKLQAASCKKRFDIYRKILYKVNAPVFMYPALLNSNMMDQVQCHTAASLPSSLDAGSKQQKEKVMRIFKNDLTHYFLREHDQLPASYLKSCNKFFKELSSKRQATSFKLQAASCKKQLHKVGTRVKNRFNRKV